MIPIQRVPAPDSTQQLLNRRTTKVAEQGNTPEAARAEWRNAEAAKRDVRQLLERMAHGARRCMYCEDNLGTDIDHFQPIAHAPSRTFEWINHLLACSHCNSNEKRDAYPVDPDGLCMLVDPSLEDPADHLTLLLASGEYQAKTLKGQHTVEVFGLNRGDLIEGRMGAFAIVQSTLRDWHDKRVQGRDEVVARTARALVHFPFAGVLRAIVGLRPALAEVVLDAETIPALKAWRAEHG